MKPDDTICYCYNVSLRKLSNYARRECPRHPSEMTQCLDAGTGCGWCIPFLQKLVTDPDAFSGSDLTPEQYEQQRRDYIRSGQPRNKF
ncbi:MAG: (2Fe-2S)-binding protein [bacterium]|nr:(2Fe-2S)-binding protein [bacterium]